MTTASATMMETQPQTIRGESSNLQRASARSSRFLPPPTTTTTMTSFLHAASSKILFRDHSDQRGDCHHLEGKRHKRQRMQRSSSKRQGVISSLNSLIVEEEDDDGVDQATKPSCPNLAFSLAMDAAYAAVSSSVLPCRGCRQSDDSSVHLQKAQKDNRLHPRLSRDLEKSSCYCCKAAVLIPALDRKGCQNLKQRPKKKRRMEDKGIKRFGRAAKTPFPMRCHPDTNPDDIHDAQPPIDPFESFESHGFGAKDNKDWDREILSQIQIKYVHSLSDAIRYLAYAPSLPGHMQPLDGIFLLGMGQLLSREEQLSSKDKEIRKMEITHLLSMLNDTRNVLQEQREEVLKSNCELSGDPPKKSVTASVGRDGVNILATIDNHTFSSLPDKLVEYFYQWIDVIASIKSIKGGASNGTDEDNATNDVSQFELCVNNSSISGNSPAMDGNQLGDSPKESNSFCFRVVKTANDHYQEIIWSVND